jgi:hypothetical protein
VHYEVLDQPVVLVDQAPKKIQVVFGYRAQPGWVSYVRWHLNAEIHRHRPAEGAARAITQLRLDLLTKLLSQLRSPCSSIPGTRLAGKVVEFRRQRQQAPPGLQGPQGVSLFNCLGRAHRP